MRRLAGRLLLLAAGAAAAWWAWNTVNGDEAKPEPGPRPEPDPTPEPTPEEAVEAPAPQAPEPDTAPAGDADPVEGAEPDADNRAPEPLEEADNRPPPAEPAPSEPLELKGVAIPAPDRLVAWVNGASEAALGEAGLTAAATKVVLAERPFDGAEALADTRGIGPKTLQALAEASEA